MGLTSPALDHRTARPLVFDWDLAFTEEENRLAASYWAHCCGGRAMPARADLKVQEMRKFLAHIALIEIRPDVVGSYFVKLAGTKQEEIFGPMTGHAIDGFLAPQISARWRAMFDPVRELKRPLRVTTALAFQDRHWVQTEVFAAPLGDDGTTVSMLFTSFTARGSARVA